MTIATMRFSARPSAVAMLAMAASLAACGGSSGGGGGTTCEPVAFSMLNVANSEAKVCAAAIKCMAESCADTVLECAGPDYATGVFGGTCASYFACVKGCNCVKSCADACPPDSLDCSSCLSSKLAMGCTLTCMSAIASCGKK
jgi:hypothetical protein